MARRYAPAIIAAFVFVLALRGANHAADFTWPLRGARQLLAGDNPYTALVVTGTYPADAPLFYPLPAVLLVLPLTPLSYPLAGAFFVGLSVALLCSVYDRHPALLGMLASAPLWIAVVYGQWSVLLTAAIALPWLGCILTAKPSLGAVLWLWRPTRRGALSASALVLLSLLVLPSWPLYWLDNISQGRHVAPILTCPLLALGILRWRDERIRLILLLSIAPQYVGSCYDHLPLFLAMRSRRLALVLAAASWLGVLAGAWLGREWAGVGDLWRGCDPGGTKER